VRAQVTGAGKGIGRELCKLLAACGAKVVALSRTQSDLDSLCAEIEGCEAFVCDLSDTSAVAASMEAVLAAGPCPLLVNNAAIAINGPFLEASTEDFDSLFAINVRAVMQVSQILAKAMIEAGGGGVRLSCSKHLYATN
jgi:NAD(P)-dependent dehydrogenase (short-subunit alcohol dehydrogenase family)